MNSLLRWFRKTPSAASVETQTPPSAPTLTEPPPVAVAVEEKAALRAAIESADSVAIARFAIEGTSAKVRQLAAQAVEDPEQLKQLLRAVRGRDKNVYRILRQKCDALLAGERAAAQWQEELNAASAALERHSTRPYDPLFTPMLEQLEIRWRPLSERAPESLRLRAQQAMDRGRETIALHLKEIAAQAARELAEANAAAEANRMREFEQAQAAAAAAEAVAAEAARKKEIEGKLAAEALAIRQIGGLIAKALRALKEGGSGRAAGLRQAIEAKLADAPPLPPHLSRQLQQLDARLGELKDWKSFAATPKRAELIERMELLAGAELPPLELANEIKRLQALWKTVSRGVAEDTDAEWQRFHQAAQIAYQPCKIYFAEQAQRRAENLESRKALLERLLAFESGHDWEHPDWGLVGTVLREAQQQWRLATPVDRAAGTAVQDPFDAAIARLQVRFDEELARNTRQKKNLIARAQRLLAAPDARDAADEVKQLQLKWKTVGAVPRTADRALWDEFRQHCDAVFQRRQQEHATHVAQLRAQKAEEAAMRAELEEAARAYGTQAAEDGGKFSQLQSAFQTLREIESQS